MMKTTLVGIIKVRLWPHMNGNRSCKLNLVNGNSIGNQIKKNSPIKDISFMASQLQTFSQVVQNRTYVRMWKRLKQLQQWKRIQMGSSHSDDQMFMNICWFSCAVDGPAPVILIRCSTSTSILLLFIRQPPSNEQKIARRLCCTFGGGSAESCKVV